MKKQTDPSPSVTGRASLDFIIMRLIEVVQATSARKQTKAQKTAAEILSRCLLNRYAEDHPLPFGEADERERNYKVSRLNITSRSEAFEILTQVK
jgi:hypothetical protein